MFRLRSSQVDVVTRPTSWHVPCSCPTHQRDERRGIKTPRTSPRFGGETTRTCFWRLGAASLLPPCTARRPRGLVEVVRGLLAVLLLTCVPSTALAQPALVSSGDVDAAQAEVDRDYAQALASDCGLACRALDSMRHATE